MELIEVKEILRKSSVEVDIQGHGKHIALFEADFERVAIELLKKINKHDVVGQSEQLKAFLEWQQNNYIKPYDTPIAEQLEDYKQSL